MSSTNAVVHAYACYTRPWSCWLRLGTRNRKVSKPLWRSSVKHSTAIFRKILVVSSWSAESLVEATVRAEIWEIIRLELPMRTLWYYHHVCLLQQKLIVYSQKKSQDFPNHCGGPVSSTLLLFRKLLVHANWRAERLQLVEATVRA